jgi:hypothetical protein
MNSRPFEEVPMLRSVLRAAVVLSAVLAASPALAADMGTAGTLYIGAERMFGLSFNHEKQTPAGGTITNSHTDIGLLWNPGLNSPYTIPRMGVDFAVIDNLTVGAGLGFWTSSASRKTEGGGATVDQDGDTTTAILLSPRVGYIIGLSDKVGIWLRGGFTYFSISSSSPEQNGTKRTNSSNGLAFSLDPIFVVSPVEHFGLFGGLMVDLPLSGKVKGETTTGGSTVTNETDTKFQNIGLNFGVLGYF